MNVLVLNCGSSSVKSRLIATDLDLITQNADRRLAKGIIERIGGEAIIRFQVEGHDPQRLTTDYIEKNLCDLWMAPDKTSGPPKSNERTCARFLNRKRFDNIVVSSQ